MQNGIAAVNTLPITISGKHLMKKRKHSCRSDNRRRMETWIVVIPLTQAQVRPTSVRCERQERTLKNIQTLSPAVKTTPWTIAWAPPLAASYLQSAAEQLQLIDSAAAPQNKQIFCLSGPRSIRFRGIICSRLQLAPPCGCTVDPHSFIAAPFEFRPHDNCRFAAAAACSNSLSSSS